MFEISSAFTPAHAVAGGIAIGAVAVARFFMWGEVTGASTILSSLLKQPMPINWVGNLSFVAGLAAGGAIMQVAECRVFDSLEGFNRTKLVLGGLCVGFGSILGGGCASLHGVCGLGRLSLRSLAATLTIGASAMLTAFLTKTSEHVQALPETPNLGFEAGIVGAIATVLVTMTATQGGVQDVSREALEFLMGTIFALGHGLSGMTRISKVINFLDISRSSWDPSTLCVILGSLCVAIPGFHTVLSRGKPALAATFAIPTLHDIDLPLIAGSAILGIGCGLVGLGPAPAITNLGSGQIEPLMFVAAMLGGIKAQQLLDTSKVPGWMPIAAVAIAAFAAAASTYSKI